MRASKFVLLLRSKSSATPELGREIALRTTAWRDAHRDTTEDVVVHVTESAPPRVTLVPFRREGFAMVSVRAEPAAIDALRTSLASMGRLACYRVDESVPRARARTEPAGSIAAGPALVTLFRKHPKLDRETFLREWHGHHTPLALEVHPLVGYVRNVVRDLIDEEAPSWDGIVIESFARDADVRSTVRFFGGPTASRARAVINAIRVGLHASSFLDLRTIENHLVTERALDGAR
ncbi:MAG: EthD domain-containing protein [Myxococcales bacterium]|nr:EthD domain-containing protein [Myxococcales bacterium]